MRIFVVYGPVFQQILLGWSN